LCCEGDQADFFRSYYAVIDGAHIFCYSNEKCTRLSTVQSLNNVEVELGKPKMCLQRKVKMYPVSFWFPKQAFRSFYFLSKETQKQWYEEMVKHSENQKVHKHYIVGLQVDKGQFGEVFKGKKKETNEPVALKIIKYKNMIWEEHF